MSELLRKVEEAVLGSISGTAPALAQYYAHWERAVFHALNALTLGGMTSLQRMLEGVSPANPGPHTPLFEVCKIFAVAGLPQETPFRPPPLGPRSAAWQVIAVSFACQWAGMQSLPALMQPRGSTALLLHALVGTTNVYQ